MSTIYLQFLSILPVLWENLIPNSDGVSKYVRKENIACVAMRHEANPRAGIVYQKSWDAIDVPQLGIVLHFAGMLMNAHRIVQYVIRSLPTISSLVFRMQHRTWPIHSIFVGQEILFRILD
jgi:hypothetical protein